MQDMVPVLEEMVRTHVVMNHELAGTAANVGNHEGFNAHLNVEEMHKHMVLLQEW